MANYNYYWSGGQGFPGAPGSSQAYPYLAGLPQPVNQAQVEPSPSQGSGDSETTISIDLKVLNPSNKKDFRMYILRHISSDLDSPNKLKNEIIEQYGEATQLTQNMEIGYFHHSRKIWINSRLDVNDMWSLVAKGEKVTFWCVGNEENIHSIGKKRARDCDPQDKENSTPKKSAKSNIEAQRELVKEYELELKKKHEGLYSIFQYKLWAEMYAKGGHTSLETPPAVAMFNRDKQSTKGSHGHNDVVVSVIDKLCAALTPKQEKGKPSSTLSPMRKAELRSTYIKQLGELKLLYESGVLTEMEFEEQREELVELMRQLKNK